MFKKTTTIFTGVILLMFGLYKAIAQQKGKEKTVAAAKPKKAALTPVVYLGKSDFAGGKISVSKFSSLLKQGISARDSAGNTYNIVGFYLNYDEMRLYEDSVGESIITMDLSREYCSGDTVSTNIAQSIFDRVKKGDTVFFDQVMLTKNAANRRLDTFLGKDLKCIIMK
ncbi:MAG: hypothetical protein H7257_04025 [Taibaiella sp.]|nr:hypothetical protein [Taibaiella sp.]